jgi:hypothetical protein
MQLTITLKNNMELKPNNMNINILKAVQIYTTKKEFIVYTIVDNKIDKMILTNDLTRHRKKFGINSKFLLTDIIKKELRLININL